MASPPVRPPSEPYGSIIDRFRGTEWDTTPPPAPSPPSSGLRSGGLIATIGVVVLVGAAVLAVAVLPPGGPAGPPPASHVILTPPPTPGPGDLVLAAFWRQIAAADLDYRVSISGSVNMGSQGGSQTLALDVHGDDFEGSLVERIRGEATASYVILRSGGVLYIRTSTQRSWTLSAPATELGLIARPFLALEDERQLTYGGTVVVGGTTLNRLVSSDLYRPGVNRILPIVLASLPATTTSLELLVTDAGIPVQATFTCHAPTDLRNGLPALDGTASYTFTMVGEVGPIPSPKL